MYQFKVGTRYNLQFHGSQLLGVGLKNAELIAVCDYRMAMLVSNVTHTHAAMIGYLGAEVTRDAGVLSYVIFQTDSGRAAYAYPWIVEDSIEVAQNRVLTITLPGTSPDDAAKVKEVLSLAGYKSISITTSG